MSDGHERFRSERFSVMTHLQPGAGTDTAEHPPAHETPPASVPADPRGVRPQWSERVITCTGPNTFRLRVPILTPLPSEATVQAFADELESRWLDAETGRYAMQVKAVRGWVDETSMHRGTLTLLVTTAGGGDRHVDAARLAELVRAEARRAQASRTRTSSR